MVLILLAKQLGKKKRHLRIWDPYVSSRKEVDVSRRSTFLLVRASAVLQNEDMNNLLVAKHPSHWQYYGCAAAVMMGRALASSA